MCCAGAAPKWLKTPSLPRTFVLEMLDFVLTNSAQLFRCLPAFENTLSVWISQLLGSQLQVNTTLLECCPLTAIWVFIM